MADYTQTEQEEMARRLNAYPLLKKERDEFLEGLRRLADIVHARICWEHDFGEPPSSLDALTKARALIAKVEK